MTPNSNRKLHCMVNLSGYATGYPVAWWATSPLVTDLAVILAGEPDPPAKLAEVLAAIAANGEGAMAGSYVSGGQVKVTMESYPDECIADAAVPAGWKLPASLFIDLANVTAAHGFADLIVAAAQTRARPMVFLDNIIHPSALEGWLTWSVTCAYLAYLKAALNANGKLLIANVAAASFAMSDADVDLFQDAVDGMAFEMPLHPTARGNRANTLRQMAIYRQWLDAGKIVVLVPVDLSVEPAVYTATEARMIAGLAALVRRPGDALFVSHLFYEAVPDWSAWPELLGQAQTDWEFATDSVLTRSFGGYKLSVDVVHRIVEIQPNQRMTPTRPPP